MATNIVLEYACYLCGEEFDDMRMATSHLKSKCKHKQIGDQLQCMKIQEAGMFCDTKFSSIKSLQAHMKNKKCKLLSNDVNDNESNGNLDKWSCVLDDFGALNIHSNSSANEENQEKSSYSIASCIESFVNKLVISNIQRDVVNDIIHCSKELVHKTIDMIRECNIGMESKKEVDSTLDSTELFVSSCLDRFISRYKRKKHYTSLPNYVAPQTISLNGGDSYQYVSILKQIEKLFANENFRKMYFTFNNNHKCQDGVYERFCCGSKFKNTDFFQSANNIQIQIYYDDVQLTNPLKNRPYKVCAIYFVIRNLPPEYVSRLDNIYVVALCDSKIVTKYGCNVILEPLVNELKKLETEGISVDIGSEVMNGQPECGEENSCNSTIRKLVLRGTLVQASFDNLGGNEIFGMSKCFNSTCYCRICFCKKVECQTRTIEVASKIRTKAHYDQQIAMLNSARTLNKSLKLEDTFGITNYSVFNDLNFFHTIENRTQDIMHDVYEGAMPSILSLFFEYLIERDIVTEDEIQLKISSFNYGKLERKNKPSILCIKKKNLNQNASQMHCLIIHTPFIFQYLLRHCDENKRKIVHKIWPNIEYILKIDQILCSSVIKEKDLINLENYTDILLKHMKSTFKIKLFPKLHFLTHYANTIRIMGPLRFSQIMRGDAKHQVFTQCAKRCRNYINIYKTLAEKHQEILAAKCNKNTYSDNMEISKKNFKFVEVKGKLKNEFENYSEMLSEFFEDLSQVTIINFIIINSFRFSKDLFFIFNKKMHRIDAVLKNNGSFIFLCTQFHTVKYFKFANCFEIEKSTNVSLIEFDRLECKRSFESKELNGKPQIIAADLDILPVYENYIL